MATSLEEELSDVEKDHQMALQLQREMDEDLAVSLSFQFEETGSAFTKQCSESTNTDIKTLADEDLPSGRERCLVETEFLQRQPCDLERETKLKELSDEGSGLSGQRLLAQPKTRPSEWLAQPNTRPSEWLAQPNTRRSEWLAQPQTTPSEWLAQPKTRPSEWLAQPNTRPSEWLAQLNTRPSLLLAEPQTGPSLLLAQPGTRPTELLTPTDTRHTELLTLPQTSATVQLTKDEELARQLQGELDEEIAVLLMCEDEQNAEFDDKTDGGFDDNPDAEFDDNPDAEFDDNPDAEFDDNPDAEFDDNPDAEFDDNPDAEFDDNPDAEFDDNPDAEFDDRADVDEAERHGTSIVRTSNNERRDDAVVNANGTIDDGDYLDAETDEELARRLQRVEDDGEVAPYIPLVGFARTEDIEGATANRGPVLSQEQMRRLEEAVENNDYEVIHEFQELLGEVKVRGLRQEDLNYFPSQSVTRQTCTDCTVDVICLGCRDWTCYVCLHLVVNGDTMRTLPCLHSFHRACIDQWLQMEAVCPICKLDLKEYLKSERLDEP